MGNLHTYEAKEVYYNWVMKSKQVFKLLIEVNELTGFALQGAYVLKMGRGDNRGERVDE